mmetsp:Transcript_10917/g.29263  ORF Transcript_10917/g.29263 Transcript_10917/m.29263 type:complete len:200 (-) Transcript_10917:1548-2147(-)
MSLRRRRSKSWCVLRGLRRDRGGRGDGLRRLHGHGAVSSAFEVDGVHLAGGAAADEAVGRHAVVDGRAPAPHDDDDHGDGYDQRGHTAHRSPDQRDAHTAAAAAFRRRVSGGRLALREAVVPRLALRGFASALVVACLRAFSGSADGRFGRSALGRCLSLRGLRRRCCRGSFRRCLRRRTCNRDRCHCNLRELKPANGD